MVLLDQLRESGGGGCDGQGFVEGLGGDHHCGPSLRPLHERHSFDHGR